MLTIKHIREDGIQNVFPASSALFIPSGVEQLSSVPQPRVELDGKGSMSYLTDGTVYVMNAEGKTVSKWPLSGTVYVD